MALILVGAMTIGNAEARRSSDPGGHTNNGVAAAKKKDYDTAISEFTKAIEEQPKDAKNYKNRGLVYKLTNKLKEAQADFAKAIELDPKDVDALTERAKFSCASSTWKRRSRISMPH